MRLQISTQISFSGHFRSFVLVQSFRYRFIINYVIAYSFSGMSTINHNLSRLISRVKFSLESTSLSHNPRKSFKLYSRSPCRQPRGKDSQSLSHPPSRSSFFSSRSLIFFFILISSFHSFLANSTFHRATSTSGSQGLSFSFDAFSLSFLSPFLPFSCVFVMFSLLRMYNEFFLFSFSSFQFLMLRLNSNDNQ